MTLKELLASLNIQKADYTFSVAGEKVYNDANNAPTTTKVVFIRFRNPVTFSNVTTDVIFLSKTLADLYHKKEALGANEIVPTEDGEYLRMQRDGFTTLASKCTFTPDFD